MLEASWCYGFLGNVLCAIENTGVKIVIMITVFARLLGADVNVLIYALHILYTLCILYLGG